MKKVQILLVAAFALVGTTVMAQQDFSGPQYAKWGDTPEARETNIMASNFLAESVKNRNYDDATTHLMTLINNRPEATVNTFKYGKIVFRGKINRATSNAEKQGLVDTLLMMYDLQAKYFGDNDKEGRADILANKGAELLTYRSGEREAIRNTFKAAIEAGGEMAKPETMVVYFQNLCDDYQKGEIHPDDVIAEYERLEPMFDKQPEATQARSQFDSALGRSGVASCESLERIFGAKLAANPNDEKSLKQAVALMSRAKCNTTFFFNTAETYYKVNPSAETAMALAQMFQEDGKYDKAVKYLRETLNVEKSPVERERLLTRIGMVELVANNTSSAATAARQALELNAENGVAYFVLAQCYASSASACGGFAGSTVYWAASDAMSKAINFMSESDSRTYGDIARSSLNSYRSRFPSSEECFFNEMKVGDRYTVSCGAASGVSTTVRTR